MQPLVYGIHHIGVNVPDLEAARRFYETVFGFEVVGVDNWGEGNVDVNAYVGMDESDATYQLLAQGRAASWDLAYEKLDLPVLVMSGTCDRVFYNPNTVAELIARLPNVTELVYEDLGHLIPIEDGARTASALKEFGAQL